MQYVKIEREKLSENYHIIADFGTTREGLWSKIVSATQKVPTYQKKVGHTRT